MMPKRCETFYAPRPNEATTSRTIFQGSTTAAEQQKQMDTVGNAVADKDDIMLMHRCYQFTPSNYPYEVIRTLQQKKIPFTKYEFMMTNFTEVQGRVVQAVQDAYSKLKNVPIQGDIYVLLTVAPYWRDNQGRTLTTQWNSQDYLSKSDLGSGKPLYTHMIIVYTNYLVNEQGAWFVNPLTPTKWDDLVIVNRKLSTFESRDKLCTLEVPTADPYRSFGGCMHTSQPYDSKCLGSQNPNSTSAADRDRVTPSIFAVAYKVNRRYPRLMANKVFA